MITLTTTQALADFCDKAANHPYVTVDTEFLRERTYYSKLCLVQLAVPGDAEDDAVLLDPLAEGVSLEPLYELFRNPDVVKVFHAARQDLEIFFIEGGVIPAPLFDSQVAAMVCGFGEQAGYETLVRKIANHPLDKSSRFTDWSRRPLSEAQKTYALGDVTHLRVIYEFLADKLEKSGRQSWVEEELQILADPETYITRPHEAWKRIKTRSNSGKFLAIVRELAQFREEYAAKTCPAQGFTKTMCCWNWPRPSRAASVICRARVCCSERRARARSQTVFWPRSRPVLPANRTIIRRPVTGANSCRSTRRWQICCGFCSRRNRKMSGWRKS